MPQDDDKKQPDIKIHKQREKILNELESIKSLLLESSEQVTSSDLTPSLNKMADKSIPLLDDVIEPAPTVSLESEPLFQRLHMEAQLIIQEIVNKYLSQIEERWTNEIMPQLESEILEKLELRMDAEISRMIREYRDNKS